MCGITGFTSSKSMSDDLLAFIATKMAQTIKHRGPDAQGVWTDENSGIALAQRRLSILDLSSAGAQPMVSSNGDWVIVYNGEVYNTDELRQELDFKKINWRGSSDTEVILEAIATWGVRKTTPKLIGMFAYAIWQRSTRELTLVRDRLGIKPLYWSQTSTTVIFGSEIKSIRQHPESSHDLNRSAIANFLRNGYINNPSTVFNEIHQLEPGWIAHWREGSGKPPRMEQYWSLEQIARNGLNNTTDNSPKECIDQLDALLADATHRRMVADVPLGAFLSGGVDSSVVVAQMQRASTIPVKTFSIGFEDPKYDESGYATEVAKHLGTDHTNLVISPSDALKIIPEIPTLFDEPFSDPSQIPTYLVSQLARQHVTVALSGDGGDELFAGYNRYSDTVKYSKFLSQPALLRNAEAKILDHVGKSQIRHYLPGKIKKHLAGSKTDRVKHSLRDGTIFSLYRRALSRIESPSEILLDCHEPEYTKWEPAKDFITPDDRYAFMQYIDTVDYLPDDILTKVDRTSMAVSLEARVPILDHRVVEFSWSLPESMKVNNGDRKWILKQVLKKYVPESLTDRPKKGFAVPIGNWIRGPLRDWTEHLLSPESLSKTNVLDPTPVRRKLNEHMNKTTNWDLHLWDMLCLQAWLLNEIKSD